MIIKVLRIYFEFFLLYYCFIKYFEIYLLEVVNGCCMEDEFEFQLVLVLYGFQEDIFNYFYSRLKQFF